MENVHHKRNSNPLRQALHAFFNHGGGARHPWQKTWRIFPFLFLCHFVNVAAFSFFSLFSPSIFASPPPQAPHTADAPLLLPWVARLATDLQSLQQTLAPSMPIHFSGHSLHFSTFGLPTPGGVIFRVHNWCFF